MSHLARALDELEKHGLLLLQDPVLPNLASLCAGEPIRGSWWAHPAGKLIFRVASQLEDRPEVMSTKLVSKKVTFVHQTHFPLVISVGSAKERWQLAALDAGAKRLLGEVEESSPVVTSGPEAKALEERLLVHARQVHTQSGKHALELSSWDAFRKKSKIGRCPPPNQAQKALEGLVSEMAKGSGVRATLPWQTKRRGRGV